MANTRLGASGASGGSSGQISGPALGTPPPRSAACRVGVARPRSSHRKLSPLGWSGSATAKRGPSGAANLAIRNLALSPTVDAPLSDRIGRAQQGIARIDGWWETGRGSPARPGPGEPSAELLVGGGAVAAGPSLHR